MALTTEEIIKDLRQTESENKPFDKMDGYVYYLNFLTKNINKKLNYIKKIYLSFEGFKK